MKLFINKIGLQKKLLFIFFITIFVPLLIFSLVYFNHQNMLLHNEVSSSSEREVNQMVKNMDSELVKINSVMRLIYNDTDINNFILSKRAPKTFYNNENAYLNSILRKYYSMMDNLVPQFTIIALDGTCYGDPLFSYRNPDFKLEETSWYSWVERNQTTTVWVSDHEFDDIIDPSDGSYVYSACQLSDHRTWKQIGTLILGIPETELKKLYLSTISSSESIFLMDQYNNILSSSDNLRIGSNIAELCGDKLEKYSSTFITDYTDLTLLLNIRTINSTQWKLVDVLDMNQKLEKFDNARSFYLLITAICLLISIYLSYILSKRFLAPIKSLYNEMAHVKQGNFDTRVVVSSHDEIGELSEQFNEMIVYINELMSKIIREQELKRDADIRALQSQINPHFIYNTLASIRYMILSKDPVNADITILSLIKLLRSMLENSDHFISIKAEISYLEEYISIQKNSLPEAFKVNMHIDENINECLIIKFLLQPIVENAIMHGLKLSEANPVLNITGRMINHNIEFEINDNGPGFDAAELNNKLQNIHYDSSVGIFNVNNRIKLNFGKQYGIHVKSAIGAGTTVFVTIPKIDRKEIHEYYERSDC